MAGSEQKALTIAIDGPSGAGKSAVARRVAARLGYRYLDTGAMYRAVALRAHRAGISGADAERLTEIARELRIEFAGDPLSQSVFSDGEDVTEAIREPAIGNIASAISVIPTVRQALVEQQRKIGALGGIVSEGRDQTTVVFPNADVKIYLTASAEERARRRVLELTQKGISISYEDILAQQEERDERDMTRSDSPLRIAEDAVVLDSGGYTLEQTVEKALELCRE